VNTGFIARTISLLWLLCGLFCLPSLGVAIFEGLERSMVAYGITVVLALSLAGLVRLLFPNDQSQKQAPVRRQEAIVTVALVWLSLGALGGLPLYLEGAVGSKSGAFFEAISGFTTTGATVIAHVVNLSDATQLWRVVMHWLGGMGVVVLFVAIFPQLGIGAKFLFRSETASTSADGLKPQIKQTALRLWMVYLVLTALLAVLLSISGLSVFDSICHALSVLSTGGFSTRSASIGAFNNTAAEWWIILFMIAGASNFGLFYALAQGRVRALWMNTELRVFIFLNLAVSLCITALRFDGFESLGTILRGSVFQTVAVSSTTGLMTEDFDRYPEVAKLLLFSLMLVGGCTGSTAGGLKVLRLLIGFKSVMREIASVVYPREVRSLKVGHSLVTEDAFRVASVLVFAFASVVFASSFVLVFNGLPVFTALSASVSALSSVGPAFGELGPTQHFGDLHAASKFALSFVMVAGRLEILILLAIFSSRLWRR
jgi:trk system potassium uptake protein TrkH